MSNINYSVIIPHYNIPDLLMRCLHSIPVRPDVQVIVVDDCSPGADKYLETYPELSRPYLEFYSTPKGGSAGRARNVGLDHAKGKWLLFADADDFYTENFEEHFLDKYVNRDEDIIYFNCRGVMSDDVTKSSNRINYIADRIQKFKTTHDEPSVRLTPVPYGKCIKRSLVTLHHIRFDETRYANDTFFAISCGCKADNIYVVDETYYVVTERIGSLANKMGTKEGELAIRMQVRLRTQQMVIQYGYTSVDFCSGFLISMIAHHEFKNFQYYFHHLPDYGISKWDTLWKMFRNRKRYSYLYVIGYVVDFFYPLLGIENEVGRKVLS